MLTIRDHQMTAFRLASIGLFSDELFEHLMNTYPSTCAAMGGERELRASIQRNLDKASRWGVESANGVTALFELFIQFGASFERSPLREWSLNILNHPVMAGDLKVDTVWERHYALIQGRHIVQA